MSFNDLWCKLMRMALLAFLIVVPAVANAENRVALVIGNGAYAHAPLLKNPRNDAGDVTAALKRLSFQVIMGIDLSKRAMDEHIARFARSARSAEVALFYYSGHALQFSGVNYLAPIDATLAQESDLKSFTRADSALAAMEHARKAQIFVLDACRNNPFFEDLRSAPGLTHALALKTGLAKMQAPQGMLVAFSAQAEHTAEDGSGRNSPFTASLGCMPLT